MDIISRIKALNLPLGKYIVFGSAVMKTDEYLRYKRCLPREKDKKDVVLLEAYVAAMKGGV